MKKIVTISIIIVLTVAIAGAFSVNYIFDKMIGNQILSQLDLPSDLIDSIIGSDLEDEPDEVQEADKESNEKNNTNEGNKKESSQGKDSIKSEEFTNDQLKKIQEEFSTMDKLKVMRMISSKLSSDEIKSLMSITSGGVSKEELNNIKEVLKEKLSDDDIKYLNELYEKYY